MGETRAETHAEMSSNAGATGPGSAGHDQASAREGRFLRRWLAFSMRRERRLEQIGSDPDPRFTFANERTFLAWNRTALALIVAGLAITQLLPPFPGVPLGRHLIGVPLIALGAILAIAGYLEWRRNQWALRHAQPLPPSPLPRILAASIAVMAIIAGALVALSAALR